MRIFAAASFISVPILSIASAAPVRRNADPNNVLVLQLVNVLERLESKLYQGFEEFDSPSLQAAKSASDPEDFIQQFKVIERDDAKHAADLASTIQSLDRQPISDCTFDFSSVLTDISTVMATAHLLEHVGEGAYLGAAELFTDPNLSGTARSLAADESRHEAMLSGADDGQTETAFDQPLLPSEVLAIVGPFISGCDIGITANPTLTVTNAVPVKAGSSLVFESDSLGGSDEGMFCQFLTGDMPSSLPLLRQECVVPDSLSGTVAVFITSDATPLSSNIQSRAAASGKIVAGPAMISIGR
ncbi:hypothetical protein DENSPDRAFT_830772 [Dentipellis sp. KUC8613]|nr:hypothetical protein DENSPDRAFT_830772 [Dentipellis sp. KUC8613]